MTEDFEWGVATSSYQIEGAVREDGRTDGLWDWYCGVPGAVRDGTNGDHAVDHYHRMEEDLDLIAGLGVSAYRFSISWPRVMPHADQGANAAGIDFYRRLCEGLTARGVRPVATLYHWDLPLYLHRNGGWTNRQTVDAFGAFAAVCFDALGDIVSRWCTINEPWCQAILGYAEGRHAPGQKDQAAAWQAAHHLLLAHGRAVSIHAESAASHADIGIVLNLHTPRPARQIEDDLRAVDLFMDERNRLFLDPLLGRGYPSRLFESRPGVSGPVVEDGDMDAIAQIGTFIGLNYYDEETVEHDPDPDGLGWRYAQGWAPQTDMGWPIMPGGLERQLKWACEQIGSLPIVISENGIAVADPTDAGRPPTDDDQRIVYLETHLQAMERARRAGANVIGYYYWSLMDNFEWEQGLSKRFGLVHIDYKTFERTPRRSYYYYRDRIANGPDIGRDALLIIPGR